MNKNGRISLKIIGQAIGLLLLVIGIFITLLNTTNENWDKLFVSVLTGVAGVILIILSRNLLSN